MVGHHDDHRLRIGADDRLDRLDHPRVELFDLSDKLGLVLLRADLEALQARFPERALQLGSIVRRTLRSRLSKDEGGVWAVDVSQDELRF